MNDFTASTAWALSCLRRINPKTADEIEAAMRCMKYLQSLPAKATVTPIRGNKQ